MPPPLKRSGGGFESEQDFILCVDFVNDFFNFLEVLTPSFEVRDLCFHTGEADGNVSDSSRKGEGERRESNRATRVHC